VDGFIPANPWQPDGSPFVVGGGGSIPIISVNYDPTPGNLTIRWGSSDAVNYRIEEWNRTVPGLWVAVSPEIPGAAGLTETEHTLNGIFGPTRLFRVRETGP
jgi:hypothetical protein